MADGYAPDYGIDDIQEITVDSGVEAALTFKDFLGIIILLAIIYSIVKLVERIFGKRSKR